MNVCSMCFIDFNLGICFLNISKSSNVVYSGLICSFLLLLHIYSCNLWFPFFVVLNFVSRKAL